MSDKAHEVKKVKGKKMNYFKFIILPILIIAVAVAAIAITICHSKSKKEFAYYPMGGVPFKILAYGRSKAAFGEDVAKVKEKVEKIEDSINRHRTYSKISIINARAHKEFMKLDEDLAKVFDISKKWYDLSEGAFDVTFMPISWLWKDRAVPPTEDEIATTLINVGTNKLIFNDEGMLKFEKEGMGIDFGGVAKGYIVDTVAADLKARGVADGVVDVGGVLNVWGSKDFSIEIQNPSNIDELFGSLMIKNRAAAKSGIYRPYQRETEFSGKKYSHIFNPKTGKPVENDLDIVIILAPNSVDADAVATAIMVLGREAGIEFLNKMEGFDAVMIDTNKEIWTSKAVANNLKLKPDLVVHTIE